MNATAVFCVSCKASLYVRLIIMQSSNGQPLTQQDERLLSPKGTQGRYTGEILLRTRPKTYRKVVQLLSENTPVIRIMRLCSVAQDTVIAVRNREAQAISERKNSLAGLMSNIAEIGGANVERKIGKASVRDAIIGTGVAIDKMLALTGQTPAVEIANVILPTEAEREERRQLHDKLDEIAARLKARNAST
jgi:hypothetical protein